MKSIRCRRILPLATSIAALLSALPASATLLYWDTNGATANSGAATGNWDGSTALWNTVQAGNVAPLVTLTTNADDLFFAAGTGGTGGTVTVSGTQAAHSLTFEEGGITLSGGTAINLGSDTAGSGMFFANVSGYNINTAIILNSVATEIAFANRGNQTVTFGTTGTITGSATTGIQNITIGSSTGGTTFSGIISDGGAGGKVGVTVLGAGTYTLGAANSYTGATSILSGTLQINNASTFTNTSAINLGSTARLNVNAANSSLAELATAGGGSGVVAGSFLRYSAAQTTAGASNGPGTIFGTVELNLTNVNPNYILDFGAGGALTNVLAGAVTYTSALTLSGTASIDSSQANATHITTYSTGGITASTVGTKTLHLSGSNTGANTISGAIGDGSGTIGVTKGGGGTWLLSGTNTYTGNTRVDVGTLQFANQVSLYNNGLAATWTKNNIIVGNGATLAFNVGGAGQFTKTNINTLLGLSDSASNGFTTGSNVGLDTTGGSLLFDSVIANTNSGSNVLGLTKLGTNTLTLDQDNTYTGRTIISAGTLQLGNGSTTGKLSTSSSILNNGTLTINRSDAVAQGTDFSGAPIVGTGAFIQQGAGTTTLNADNTFSGTTTVNAGTLTLANALALQNSALVTTGAGSVTLSSVTTPTFGGLSGATGNLGTVISSGYSSVTGITLNTVVAGPFTYGGIIGEGATGMTLTKTGTGTQILSGANAYTGDTFVNGGTLTVGSGATGSISSSSGLQMGGGTFNYSRTGAGQTVDGLTVNAGNSTVNNTSAGQILTLGTITRTTTPSPLYGTVNFATLTGSITTTTGNTNSIIGPWATTGSTTTLRYAVGSPDGSTATAISALTGTTATANTLANVTDATVNYEYSAAVAAMGAGASLTANTLRYHTGAATATAINATSTLTLNGLMNAGTGLLTISGGPSTGGIIIGSTNELVIAANAQATTISAVIKDGGAAGRLVYSGGGTLTLSGLNTYSGGLVINSGIVATAAVASVSSGGTGTGPITINSGGRLTLNSGVGTLNRAITLNGGTLNFLGSGNDLTAAGTIALVTNSTIEATANNSGNAAINSNISGAGGFTKTGAGGLRLNGTNSYTGPTVVSTGGLTVKASLYGNDDTKWTPANITVASGATLALNVGGAGEFTTANAHTLFSQLSSNVNNNGLQAGSFIAVDTRNAPNGTYTYSGIITDSTGAGGGSVSFKHVGTANHILELTGSNTYTGMSIVDGNAFLKVSSLNSVFTNAALGTVHSASSSLGAPTTVLNGTIQLGTAGNTAQGAVGNSFDAGGLIYTGTGETTDRIISMNDGGGKTSTLDQSGTGHLKFISSFAALDTRGTKTLVLQGSTTGTGEIAGVIPNATSGSGTAVTKSGTGTWILSGANLYAGVTTVNGGTLRFAKQVSLYNNTQASWTKTNIIVNTGGTLALNVGGTGEFTTGNVTTLLANLGTSINNNGLRSGSAIGFDTTNAAGGTFTIADNISNSTGTGSGAVGVTKLGTNSLVLTGPSAYTGATTIQAGSLVAGADSLGTGTTGAFGASSAGALVLGNASTGASDAPGVLINGAFTVGRAITVGTGATTAFNATIGGSNTTGTSNFTGNITLSNVASYTATLQAATGGTVNFSTGTWATNNKNIRIGSTGNTGTVQISNAIATSGGINVNFGTLELNSAFTSGDMAVASGATLSGTGSVGGNATLTGNGIINKSSGTISGTLGVTGGAWNDAGSVTGLITASSGTFTIGSVANLTANGGLNVTGSGSIAAAGNSSTITGSVNYTSSADSTFGGNIAGSGKTLTMNNAAAKLILTGNSDYDGATTVDAGTLLVSGSISGSITTVNSTGILGGSGGTTGAIQVTSGGTLAPGASIGTLNAGGEVFLDTDSTFQLEINTTAGTNDVLAITGSLSLAEDNSVVLAISDLSETLFTSGELVFITYDSDTWNGSFFKYGGNVIEDDGLLTVGVNTFTLDYNYNDNSVALLAVPEPNVAVTLLGGVAMLLGLRRRRRA